MKRFIEWVLILSIGIYLIINKDLVVNFILDNFIIDTTVSVPESNEFVRNYDYLTYNYDEDYIPHNKNDFENVLFNIFNNGFDSFTLFCPKDYKECLDDSKDITSNESLIVVINNYVNPFNSLKNIKSTFITRGNINQITYEIEKLYFKEEIDEINKKIDEIIDVANINSYSDNTSKIKAFHDYLIDHTNYDETRANNNDSKYKSNTAYGALIQGYAVCSGYADAMAIFLDRLNVPNIRINEQNHIWNLIYINGEWLHLDATWDDTDYINGKHKYFLITTKKLLELDKDYHNFDRKFYLEANN